MKIKSFMKYFKKGVLKYFKKGVLKYFKIFIEIFKYFKVKYFTVHL